VASVIPCLNGSLRYGITDHFHREAAVVDAARDAVAVHWASSDSFWPAPLVAQTIAPGDQKPPIHICVAIKLSRDAGGVGSE
jgi:hypothetical protein